MTTKEQVDEYLSVVRSLVDSGAVVIVPRDKNTEGMAQLGLTQAAALGMLRSMSSSNFCSGPEQDRDRPGQDCWLFGLNAGSSDAYVKLVVEQLPQGRQRLKVLSFHPAQFPMSFPFA